jgi:hypothetical protein
MTEFDFILNDINQHGSFLNQNQNKDPKLEELKKNKPKYVNFRKKGGSSTSFEKLDFSSNFKQSLVEKKQQQPPVATTTKEEEDVVKRDFEILNALKSAENQQTFGENVDSSKLLNAEEKRDYSKLKYIFQEMKTLWNQHMPKTGFGITNEHVCRSIPRLCSLKSELEKLKNVNRNDNIRFYEKSKLESEHLDCKVCLYNRTSICQIEQFKVLVYDVSDEHIHICSPLFCKGAIEDPVLHSKLYKEIDWVYFCHNSGTMHICDRFCSSVKVTDKESRWLCSISGRYSSKNNSDDRVTVDIMPWSNKTKLSDDSKKEYDQEDVSSDNNHFFKKRMYHGEKKRIENYRTAEETLNASIQQGFSNSVVQQQIYHQNQGGRKRAGSTFVNSTESIHLAYNASYSIKTKEDAYKEAISQVALLFSPDRLKDNEDKKQSLEKNLIKDLKKDCSKAYQNKKLPIVMDLFLKADIFMKNNYIPPSVRGIAENDEIRKALISFYAKKCVLFWYVLSITTTFRDETSFTFREFVDSALSLFEEGIEIKKTEDYPHPVVIVKSDDLLSIFSSDPNASSHKTRRNGNRGGGGMNNKNGNKKNEEENEMERIERILNDGIPLKEQSQAELLKPQNAKNHLKTNQTEIKKQIKKCILETVSKRLFPIHLLRMENYDYDSIPDTCFNIPTRAFNNFKKRKIEKIKKDDGEISNPDENTSQTNLFNYFTNEQ